MQRDAVTADMQVLLIDNYDSYTYNLYQLICSVTGSAPLVYKNDQIRIEQVIELVQRGAVHAVVVSPGPGSPQEPRDAGVCNALFTHLQSTPILGVCFGHQALAHAHGASVVRAPEPVHGRLSYVAHNGHELFAGIPSGLPGGYKCVRYHSLVVDEPSLPEQLQPICWTDGQDVAVDAHVRRALSKCLDTHGPHGHPPPDSTRLLMGLAHRTRPHYGVQFHPESIASTHGARLIHNFACLAAEAAGLPPRATPAICANPSPVRCQKAAGTNPYAIHPSLPGAAGTPNPSTAGPLEPDPCTRAEASHSHNSVHNGHNARNEQVFLKSRQHSPAAKAHCTLRVCHQQIKLQAGTQGDDVMCALGMAACPHTFWLDSADRQRGRFSLLGGQGGALWRKVVYSLPPPDQLSSRNSNPEAFSSNGRQHHACLPGGDLRQPVQCAGVAQDAGGHSPAPCSPNALNDSLGSSLTRPPAQGQEAGALTQAPCNTFRSRAEGEDRLKVDVTTDETILPGTQRQRAAPGIQSNDSSSRLQFKEPSNTACTNADRPQAHANVQQSATGSVCSQCVRASDGPNGAHASTGPCAPGELRVETANGTHSQRALLRDWLKAELERYRFADVDELRTALPFDFWGGFVGYVGYEVKAETGGERRHCSRYPDAVLFFADRFVVLDNTDGSAYAVAVHSEDESCAQAAACEDWCASTIQKLKECIPQAAVSSAVVTQAPRNEATPASGQLPLQTGDDNGLDTSKRQRTAQDERPFFTVQRGREQYLKDVERCMEALFKGDSYEICLTTCLTAAGAAAKVDAWDLYLRLRKVNAAPYAAWLACGKGLPSICCSSPERFLRLNRDGQLEARPIKGTAPRVLSDASADAAVAAALAASEKDRAENLMIVDLLRNDLGRVCEQGSVHVPGMMEIETFASVHQMVSTVHGRLRADVCPSDAFFAAFPGGSMTGAPKVRSMELLDEIEGFARGAYSGCIGYFSANGTFDFNIVIRTAVVLEDEVRIGAGGAVVVQSEPEGEYAEMRLKAARLLKAVEMELGVQVAVCE